MPLPPTFFFLVNVSEDDKRINQKSMFVVWGENMMFFFNSAKTGLNDFLLVFFILVVFL